MTHGAAAPDFFEGPHVRKGMRAFARPRLT